MLKKQKIAIVNSSSFCFFFQEEDGIRDYSW